MTLPAGVRKELGVCPECQNELYFESGRLTSNPNPVGECCRREVNRTLRREAIPVNALLAFIGIMISVLVWFVGLFSESTLVAMVSTIPLFSVAIIFLLKMRGSPR